MKFRALVFDEREPREKSLNKHEIQPKAQSMSDVESTVWQTLSPGPFIVPSISICCFVDVHLQDSYVQHTCNLMVEGLVQLQCLTLMLLIISVILFLILLGRCVICMSDFAVGDPIRFLPCMHIYHKDCIEDWLVRSFTCPSCMEPVEAALLSTYYEASTE